MDIRLQILNAREERLKYIHSTIEKYQRFIVVIKCNVCGDNKNPDYTYFLKKYFLKKVLNRLSVFKTEYVKSFDGDYYLVVINSDECNRVKHVLVDIENCDVGRLIDLDLYCSKQKSVSREALGYSRRKCIVCGGDVSVCSRTLNHSVENVEFAYQSILKEFLVNLVLNKIYTAMIDEVSAWPKFGLVTKNDSGIHRDMDFNLFVKSADAIMPFLKEYCYEGFNINVDSFKKLRAIGIRAEAAMFLATNNVNTHKGLIFILGFLLPSIVNVIYYNKGIVEAQKLIKYLSSNILEDFKDETSNTYGKKIYKKLGITGVRGEVKNGLLTTFDLFNKFYGKEIDNLMIVRILVESMSVLDDTVVLHHNSLECLYNVKNIAKEILLLDDEMFFESVQDHTKDFIASNISVGGSADIVVSVLLLIYVFKELEV